jgi:hypothetical protein
MPTQTRILSPGPNATTFRTATGQLLSPPADWACLPPGDAGLTRRVKGAGPTWAVQEKVGRKLFSRGLWAPAATIARERAKLEAERATPQYAKKLAAAAQRRADEQAEYVEDFHGAVLSFLAFHPRHAAVGQTLATAITRHATPVGSGTVARTERIPIEQRAEAAVIAWMRHATTAYDQMSIPRAKGARREVRRMLAERSRRVLEAYRRDGEIPGGCPLGKALLRPQ